MIIDIIVIGLFALIEGVLGLVPAYQIAGGIASFTGSVGTWASTANAFFPMVTLGMCIAGVLSVRLFTYLWQTLRMLWDLIPFKAS